MNIYQRHNPSKLPEVDRLLRKYAGKEERFIAAVRKKYEGPPSAFSAAAAPGVPPPLPRNRSCHPPVGGGARGRGPGFVTRPPAAGASAAASSGGGCTGVARLQSRAVPPQTRADEDRRRLYAHAGVPVGGGGGRSVTTRAEGNSALSRLAQQTERLRRQREKLRDTQRIARQTERIAQESLTELQTQRESLVNSMKKTHEAQGIIREANGTLTKMGQWWRIW